MKRKTCISAFPRPRLPSFSLPARASNTTLKVQTHRMRTSTGAGKLYSLSLFCVSLGARTKCFGQRNRRSSHLGFNWQRKKE